MSTKVGKRIKAVRKACDLDKSYSLSEAVSLLKEASKVKFDESFECVFVMNIDTRDSSQSVRGAVNMPNGIGKKITVAVFARGEKAEEAMEAGADIVGAEDLIEKIKANEVSFDRCIATPDMMGLVGTVAKILGPRGIMPNPKLGTVTTNVADIVKSSKAGVVEFRADKGGIVHAAVGKVSFAAEKVIGNISALYDELLRLKPASVKSSYVKRMYVSTTMGPGLKIAMPVVFS